MTLTHSSKHHTRWFATIAYLMLFVLLAALPSQAASSKHIVSNHTLQQKLQSQSTERQHNIQTVDRFFSTPLAQHAMKIEHINPTQVKKAIPTLSNSELANLSSRANHADQQFSAGALTTNQMLLLIVVMLIVVLLVAVH